MEKIYGETTQENIINDAVSAVNHLTTVFIHMALTYSTLEEQEQWLAHALDTLKEDVFNVYYACIESYNKPIQKDNLFNPKWEV